jgi:hypothetical protein
VNIIRRSPPAGDVELAESEHGYFIELPPNGRITVNGRTYVNAPVATGKDSVTLPFMIGPLNTYTIIELLSQPIFFFRTSDDLDFKNALSNAKNNRISDDEMGRRDPNGDVGFAGVDITWTPLHAPTQQALPESEYNDAWAVDGVPMENLQDYVQNILYAPTRARYHDIFSSVLLSINDRQMLLAGFSVYIEANMLRPGRSFMMPLLNPQGHHHVLLVFRLDVNKSITLHVLDPMAWRATREDRLAIHESARQLLIESTWWRTSFDSMEDMLGQFPETSYWVDCAQEVERYELDMFTVLNAWSLAMGIELVPAFSLNEASPRFCAQAQILFDLALRNQLHWKLLCAFLISHDYARLLEQDYNPEEAARSPPQNRRFDLRVRSTQHLVTRQRAQDGVASATRKPSDIQLAANETVLVLGTGLPHTNDFLRDTMRPYHYEDIARPYALEGQWRLNSTEEEMEERYFELNPSEGRRSAASGVGDHGNENSTDPPGLSQAQDPAPQTQPSTRAQEFSKDQTAVKQGGSSDPLASNAAMRALSLANSQERQAAVNAEETPSSTQANSKTPEIDQTELKRSGRHNNNLSRSEIRNLHAGVPQNFRPCDDFRRRIDDILGDKKNEADLRDFRQREHVTMGLREWLDANELSLAVAAVTLGITQHQDASLGFGFMSQDNVQMCRRGDDSGEVLQTIRPGRPMLLPLHILQHYILLIIRINNKGVPEFSIMDSKAYHLDLEERKSVNGWAYAIARASGWWRNTFTPETGEQLRSTQVQWLPASKQPSDNECAYYVILNAWTLALGLQPNPDVHIDWSDRFFRDLLDVVHLARMGKVNWLIIYAFLRCYGFVHDGVVPEDRRFEATAEVRNDSENFLGRIVEDLSYEDLSYLDNKILLVEDLQNANQLQLPTGGRRYTDVFPSDYWDEHSRIQNASDLARQGKLNLEHNVTQLAQVAQALRNDRGRSFLDRLCATDQLSQSRKHLLESYRRYLKDWHTGHNLLLAVAPCDTSRDTIDFYNNLFANKYFKQKVKTEVGLAGHWDTAMDQVEVNMSLSAVVEAIDRLQSEKHVNLDRESIFAGGFTLSTSTNNALALMRGDSGAGKASRPRRCFLMPMFVEPDLFPEVDLPPRQGAGGHHMLAVVQENPGMLRYEVLLYDSSQHLFSTPHGQELADRVVEAMPNLGWSTHRNVGKTEEKTMIVGEWSNEDVVQQKRGGGWRCGPHTVINGWILAMGLTPSPGARFSDSVYAEFRTLAKAAVTGLLDWKTLVAWFFCRQLTMQKKLQSVLPSRQFETTHFWESEAQLESHIRDICETNDILLEVSEEIPYDHGNNPIHSSLYVDKEEQEEINIDGSGEDYYYSKTQGERATLEEGSEEQDDAGDQLDPWAWDGSLSEEDFDSDSEEEDEDDDEQSTDDAEDNADGEALNRCFEDPELHHSKRFTQLRRIPRKPRVPDALTFLDGYDAHSTEHRNETRIPEQTSSEEELV